MLATFAWLLTRTIDLIQGHNKRATLTITDTMEGGIIWCVVIYM